MNSCPVLNGMNSNMERNREDGWNCECISVDKGKTKVPNTLVHCLEAVNTV